MGRKILLADDSVTIRKVVELTFMEEDYELVAVGDGRDALAKLEDGSPDLVIADVHMGEIGGYDVCKESKKRYPDVPVLLLVGTFEPFDPSDVEKHGADAFIKKPFDSQDLLNEVGRLVQERPAAAAPEESVQATSEQASEDSGESEDPTEPRTDDQSPAAAAETAPQTETGVEAVANANSAAEGGLSDADVDRIARRVVELLSDSAIRDVAWEVVPDMAEIVVRDRLKDLERQVE